MSDAAFPEVELTASLTLPQKVENKAGSAFNAVINLNGFADGYRLTDCVITVPDGVSVTGVTMGSRIGGGNMSYNLDKSTGKLRIVYFDAQNGNTITASGTSFPLEFFTVGLALENTLDAKDVTLAVTGMTFKKSSDSETQILVNTSAAIDSSALVEGVSYSVMTLYTGDDIDLIPSSKNRDRTRRYRYCKRRKDRVFGRGGSCGYALQPLGFRKDRCFHLYCNDRLGQGSERFH